MMQTEQIRSYVMRYLEAEQCDIVEKHPAYVTVKLSPSADKDLNHRPYYWSFVERTGVTPETMTCTLIFEPEAYRELHPQPQGMMPGMAPAAAPPGMAPVQPAAAPQTAPAAPGQPVVASGQPAPGAPPQQGDSILGRYFGFVPTSFTARIPRDELTFGSRRLEQIFAAVRSKGRFVRLFEAYVPEQPKNAPTKPYESWFAVNFKVELACDMKRSEIHSIGIHLQTGEIRERFHDSIRTKKMTPRLPNHVYVTPDKIALQRAVLFLEEHLEQKLSGYDHRWAEEANLRLQDELDRIRAYYEPLLQAAEEEQRPEIEAQYQGREQEIEWQYQPRIHISVINCGLFHFPAANGAIS
ncbi:YqhG family protein [Paenibacillus sp. GD4]|jgi:hypothetical protein|uniref:YqhG family protein n=1 Tax=Paenibacillus sp. GD4 TaxID=3068890 RepID=UPI0027965174|nr:YqhG family protein [Paenibacillus sp. GD4]MDQ1909721.1 YqhG family protein [Paenibacillus sp. GD4]